MISDNPAKLGTSAVIKGLACPNERCDQHQMMVTGSDEGFYCQLCGHTLNRCKVSVGYFRWEHGNPPHNTD